MSRGRKQLERIVALRGQLHERSVLALKLANAEMVTAAKEVANGQLQLSACRDAQVTAISEGEHDQWLMARSSSALSSMAFTHALHYQRTRDQLVVVVAQDEAQLRRELRQLERVLERAVDEDRLSAHRKEQRQLEEVAQRMGIAKAKYVPS
ncbi:hypothetical protein [Terriglobus sp. TAA 43]|uniref:hypothetical protein n=1 Tax=Terriglobus sp. TAA 43 TaxID=278961 RepID=UPI000646ED8C|nr:hypothetical protein [Terriglobus sp. TAA 43]